MFQLDLFTNDKSLTYSKTRVPKKTGQSIKETYGNELYEKITQFFLPLTIEKQPSSLTHYMHTKTSVNNSKINVKISE